MQVREQQLELDMEQHTGPKLGKEYIKAIYCHPAFLAYMQSTSWETPGWMKQLKQWETLFSWAPKSLQMVTAAMQLKNAYSLEEQLWAT